MILTVVFRETALRGLARIRSDNKDLFTRTRQANTRLADQPRPDNAAARDATGICRLHAAGIRVLYEVDEEAATISVINVASTA
jgi:mRNA-degrading endonuclease RelE of RelBE toxin-antitoxin system